MLTPVELADLLSAAVGSVANSDNTVKGQRGSVQHLHLENPITVD